MNESINKQRLRKLKELFLNHKLTYELIIGAVITLSLAGLIFQGLAVLVNNNEAYRKTVIGYLSERTEDSTTIQDIRLGWKGPLPAIYLENVSWREEGGSYFRSRMGEISLSVFSPLWGGSFVNVVFRGGNLIISRSSDFFGNQEGDVSGIPMLNLDVDLNDFNLIIKENSALSLSFNKMAVRLRDGKLRGIAHGILDYGIKQIAEFNLAMKLGYGDDTLYASLNKLELESGWQSMIKRFELPKEIQDITDSLDYVVGSSQVWIDLTSQSEMNIKTSAQFKGLSFNAGKDILMENINLLAAITLKQQDEVLNWDLHLSDFQLTLPDRKGNARKLGFQDIQINKDNNIVEIISPEVQAEEAAYLAINVLSHPNIISNISAYNPRGILRDLDVKVRLNKDQDTEDQGMPNFMMDAKLVDLSTDPVVFAPSAVSASGSLAIRDTKGWFLLDDEDSGLFLPHLYKEPFYFGNVRAMFMWEVLETGEFLLVGDSSKIMNGAMNAAMRLELHIIPFQHNYIDLEIGVEDANLTQIRSFIPWRGLNPPTSAWLDQSLIGGVAAKTALSMRGDLKYFESEQTVFELGLSVEDGVLLYRKEEEPIRAPLFDIFMDTKEVRVLIPQGSEIGDIANLNMGYGVVDTLSGKFFLGGEGDINLTHIPGLLSYYALDGEDLDWQVAGEAIGNWEVQYNLRSGKFNDGYFNLQTSESEIVFTDEHRISGISGEVEFSNEGYAGSWSGYYQEQELQGVFFTTEEQNGLRISGHLSVPSSVSQYAEGSTEVNVELYTASKQDLMFSRYLVSSDLRGVELKLPYPINKRKNDLMPSGIVGEIGENGMLNSFVLGTNLRIDWRTGSNGLEGLAVNIPTKTRIRSGQVPPKLRIAQAIVVNIDSPEIIDINAWREEFSDSPPPEPSSDWTRAAGTMHERIFDYVRDFSYWDIDIKALANEETTYNNIQIKYDKDTYPWINFRAATDLNNQVEGRFRLSNSDPMLTAEFNSIVLGYEEDGDENITLSADESDILDYLPQSLDAPPNFSSLPSVQLHFANIYYKDSRIGELRFEAARTAKELKLIVPEGNLIGLNINAEVDWMLLSPTRSKLSAILDGRGAISSQQVRSLDAEDMNIHIDWQWQGVDDNFANWYDTAKGSLSINSDKGAITSNRANVVTNIISFLNIGNWDDRIGGDFSDLSTSRISYKDMKLDMVLTPNGYVTRDKATVTLSFISIEADGSYDLKNDNLDLDLIVTSPTTRILPLTALLLGASALTPLLLSIDIAGGDFINRFTSAGYKITGPLSNPEPVLDRIGDISGKNLEPDDLINQADIKSQLDGLRF